MGANDAANSWATSVGAGTVSLGWAYALGSLFETLGATFVSGFVIQNLGTAVTTGVQPLNRSSLLLAVEGIINIELYRGGPNVTQLLGAAAAEEATLGELRNISRTQLGQEKVGLHTARVAVSTWRVPQVLMLGAVSTLLSSTFWQVAAVYLSLPVSGSHSIVAGLVGFTLAAHGGPGVNWARAGWVLVGWLVSPLLSLLITAVFYTPLYLLVVRSTAAFLLSATI